MTPALLHNVLRSGTECRGQARPQRRSPRVRAGALDEQGKLYSSHCTVPPVECQNVPTPAPDTREIASELRYLIGQLARRTRENDIVTLPTRLAETLSYLDREGSMTTSELAERHSVRQQSMAATLEELDAVGYLERQPHPTDRRKILIAISQHGRERLNDDRRRRAAWLAEAIAEKLTPRERGLSPTPSRSSAACSRGDTPRLRRRSSPRGANLLDAIAFPLSVSALSTTMPSPPHPRELPRAKRASCRDESRTTTDDEHSAARRQNRASVLARSLLTAGRCRSLTRSLPRCRTHESWAVSPEMNGGPETSALDRRAP